LKLFYVSNFDIFLSQILKMNGYSSSIPNNYFFLTCQTYFRIMFDLLHRVDMFRRSNSNVSMKHCLTSKKILTSLGEKMTIPIHF